MQPTRAPDPFNSPDWMFELKWGGVRALAFIEGDKVVLRGQNGRDLTPTYPELHGLPAQVKGRNAVLDGEIIAFGSKAYPDLELLRPRMNQLLQKTVPQGPRAALFYEVSDILAVNGHLITDLPLRQRRNLLHELFIPSKTSQVCEFIEEEGVAFFDAICEHRLEGMIAKQKESLYRPGQRTRDWLEIPAQEIGQYVIGGYTFGGGERKEAFQGLLLGAYQGRELVYVGRATAGLSTPEAWRTVRLLEEMHTDDCPFSAPPAVNRFSYWCEPTLVCQVRVGERTTGGEFRFAVFVSLRPDLSPLDCRLDEEP